MHGGQLVYRVSLIVIGYSFFRISYKHFNINYILIMCVSIQCPFLKTKMHSKKTHPRRFPRIVPRSWNRLRDVTKVVNQDGSRRGAEEILYERYSHSDCLCLQLVMEHRFWIRLARSWVSSVPGALVLIFEGVIFDNAGMTKSIVNRPKKITRRSHPLVPVGATNKEPIPRHSTYKSYV